MPPQWPNCPWLLRSYQVHGCGIEYTYIYDAAHTKTYACTAHVINYYSDKNNGKTDILNCSVSNIYRDGNECVATLNFQYPSLLPINVQVQNVNTETKHSLWLVNWDRGSYSPPPPIEAPRVIDKSPPFTYYSTTTGGWAQYNYIVGGSTSMPTCTLHYSYNGFNTPCIATTTQNSQRINCPAPQTTLNPDGSCSAIFNVQYTGK